MAIYSGLGNNLIRRHHILRLHLFADNDINETVRANIGRQMDLIQPVPKKSTEYSKEDCAQFPKLMNRSENYILDWEVPVERPQYIRDPRVSFFFFTD